MLKTTNVRSPLCKTHLFPVHSHLRINHVHFKYRTGFLESPVCLSMKKGGDIRCSLIEPDGGKLVDLIVPENQRNSRRKEARSLPQIRLSRIDLEWAHVVSEGWASPIKGYMREIEFLQTLHFNCLRLQDGTFVNMSVPIVLAIDDLQKEAIGRRKDVALLDQRGKLVAIMRELVFFLFYSSTFSFSFHSSGIFNCKA